jgi:hypothetical protein
MNNKKTMANWNVSLIPSEEIKKQNINIIGISDKPVILFLLL